MDHVELDLARLEEAGRQLTTVKHELEGADARSEALAESVGHDGLAGALKDFADKWDDTRESMVADIGMLAEAATGISQAFTQLDAEYAAALEGAS